MQVCRELSISVLAGVARPIVAVREVRLDVAILGETMKSIAGWLAVGALMILWIMRGETVSGAS
ncbi:MAG: hypothetical protein JWP70_1321 [Leifsonia sp.]|nr:hypothetical protein [Leifsonia sp.]